MQSLFCGRYRLIEKLRSQAKRQTWLAFDTEKEQQVVLKRLRFGDSFEWSDLKQFERESKMLRHLDHPQIPNFLDSFEIEDGDTHEFVLVQSYVEAKSLAEHIKAGRTFSDFDIKQIAESVLSILSYLHSRRPAVIHRDIKPSNILLGDRSGNSAGKVYLVDFGSVQTPVAKTTDTFTVVGSYGYMAPEQFIGKASPASDLYSLGMTLIYLATGQHPAELSTNNSDSDWRADIQLSPYLTKWIKRLTEPELSRRLKTVEEAQDHLKKPPTLVVKEPTIPIEVLSERYSLPPWRGLPLRYQAQVYIGDLVGAALGATIGYTVRVLTVGSSASLGFGLIPTFLLGVPLLTGIIRKLFPAAKGFYSSAWMSWAMELRNKRKFVEALTKCNRAIQARPQYYDCWYEKAKILVDLERYEEAVVSYEKAIELKPGYPYAWGGHGSTLACLCRHEEAIASYDRALELKPNYSWIWGKRADSLNWLDRYEEAINSCDRAIELDADDSWAWVYRGNALMAKEVGRYEEALDSFDNALQSYPKWLYAWYQRSKVLSLLERYEEAIESIDRKLELSATDEFDNPHVWSGVNDYNRIKKAISDSESISSSEKNMLYEKLIASYNKLLTKEKFFSRGMAIAYRGATYLMLKRYSDALSDFNWVLESHDGKWQEVRYLRGLVRRILEFDAKHWQSDLREAIQIIQNNRYHSDSKVHYFELVLYHLAIGQQAEARSAYEQNCHEAPAWAILVAKRNLRDYLELFPGDKPSALWYQHALSS